MRFKNFIIVAVSVIAFFACLHGVSAATLDLIPSHTTAVVGDTVTIQVVLNSGGIASNAAEAHLTFPTTLLQIQSLTKQSLFSYWPDDPTYSNSAGTLFFSGGLPDPGYSGNSGSILTIAATASAAGTAQVCESSIIITANTDAGTNIASGTKCSTIVISSATPTVPPDAPTVTSSTHPDQNLSYNSSDPSFEWNLDSGVTGFSYSIDQVADTVPDNTSEGTDTTTAYSGLADGTWYFHIKAKNENGWGQIAHFAIHIDTGNPTIAVTITADDTDTTPDIFVQANDDGSGIRKIELIIDDGTPIDITSTNNGTYTLPELSYGDHTIASRAYDQANNQVQISGSFTIRKASVPEVINKTIENIVPESIKKVVGNATKPIQKAAETITKPITAVVKNLRKDQQVVDNTKKIAEPVSRAATVVGVASTVAALPAGLINSLFALLRFGYLLISPLFIGRRGKSWGVVVNSITRKPVGRAIVRVLDTEFNKMKESQLTDQLGRFGFIVEPGDYTLSVEHRGFIFPSKLTHLHSFETPEYTGGVVHIDSKKNSNINVTVPLDPEVEHIEKRALIWKKISDLTLSILERINWPMLIIGILVSLWALLIVPDTLNGLILLLYVFLTVLKVVRLKVTVKSFGTVMDADTKEPLGIVAVRVFDATRKTMVTTRITNEEGKFSALIQPGSYYLIVTRAGYKMQQTNPMKLSKSETLAMDVELKKVKREVSPTQIPPSMNPTQASQPSEKPKQDEIKTEKIKEQPAESGQVQTSAHESKSESAVHGMDKK